MHGWATNVIEAVGGRERDAQGYLEVFFTSAVESRQAGIQALNRMSSRIVDRDEPTSWQTRQAQYDAVCAWGVPNHALLERVTAIDLPVFVTNGDSDPMIPPRYSHLLAGLLPNAQVTLYPNSAHGFLFQHHARFAADVGGYPDGPTGA
jgi:pimeloyl-ACP methyl ester carboxylesterase